MNKSNNIHNNKLRQYAIFVLLVVSSHKGWVWERDIPPPTRIVEVSIVVFGKMHIWDHNAQR